MKSQGYKSKGHSEGGNYRDTGGQGHSKVSFQRPNKGFKAKANRCTDSPRHRPQQGNTIVCRQCGYYFARSNLRRHLAEVHHIGERRVHECQHCDYVSKRQADLNRHVQAVHRRRDERVASAGQYAVTINSSGSVRMVTAAEDSPADVSTPELSVDTPAVNIQPALAPPPVEPLVAATPPVVAVSQPGNPLGPSLHLPRDSHIATATPRSLATSHPVTPGVRPPSTVSAPLSTATTHITPLTVSTLPSTPVVSTPKLDKCFSFQPARKSGAATITTPVIVDASSTTLSTNSTPDLLGAPHFPDLGNYPQVEMDPDALPGLGIAIRVGTPEPTPPAKVKAEAADVTLQKKRIQKRQPLDDLLPLEKEEEQTIDRLLKADGGPNRLKLYLARHGYNMFSSTELREIKQEVKTRTLKEAAASSGTVEHGTSTSVFWRKSLAAPQPPQEITSDEPSWMTQPYQLIMNGTALSFDLRVRSEDFNVPPPKRRYKRKVKEEPVNTVIIGKGDCKENPIDIKEL